MAEVNPKSDGVVDAADQAWRQKAYDDIVAEIHKRQVSGSENYDKSILTLSSGGLAVSIAFLKDFIPINQAYSGWLLYWSWAAFTGATISTIISFLLSEKSLEDTKAKAYEYYIERKEEAFDRSNWADWATRIANYFSGTTFILALILSTAFIGINLERAAMIKQQNDKDQRHEEVQKGELSPTLTKVPKRPEKEPEAQPPTQGASEKTQGDKQGGSERSDR